VLRHADLSWQLAAEAAKHDASLTAVLVALAPLLVLSALSWRGRPRTFLATVTWLWPAAAFAVFLVSSSDLGGAPLHSFAGITIPLSVLAVQGVRRTGWTRGRRRQLLGALAIAIATVPASAYEMSIAQDYIRPTPGSANFITADERHALDYLADLNEPGGVMARFYLGVLVPARTGRHTFVGNCVWSQPRCTHRADFAQRLMDGRFGPRAAQAFVLRSGARFVLADCQSGADLQRLLGSILRSVHRFGCAAVYEVD